MKLMLLLTAVVLGIAYAVRTLLQGERREQIAHLPMTMMERCMEMMPDDAPPKALMSGVARIQEQNEHIITLLGAAEAVVGKPAGPEGKPEEA